MTAPRVGIASSRSAAAARRGSDLEVRSWTAASALDDLVPAWESLAKRALEPAPAAEAWMLLPSLRHLDATSVVVVTVHDARQQRLIGVFPLTMRRLHPALPLRVAELWNHMYAVNATPLVDAAEADDALDAFLRWAARGSPLVRFPELREDSELYPRLVAAIARNRGRTLVEQRWTRAFFRPAEDAESFIGALGSAHHRKEWRRQERRLGEQGRVEFDHLAVGGDLDAWLEAFVALEASGWKGREGTAFGASPSHRAWLDDVAKSASSRGSLDLIALRFEGKPIAMRLSVLRPPGAYAFKIAFDEAFLRYSPGVLLELENIRRLHAMPAIRWMDSLAVAGHSLMERVWPGRAPMQSLLVAPGSPGGRAAIAMLPALRTLKRTLSRGKRNADDAAES